MEVKLGNKDQIRPNHSVASAQSGLMFDFMHALVMVHCRIDAARPESRQPRHAVPNLSRELICCHGDYWPIITRTRTCTNMSSQGSSGLGRFLRSSVALGAMLLLCFLPFPLLSAWGLLAVPPNTLLQGTCTEPQIPDPERAYCKSSLETVLRYPSDPSLSSIPEVGASLSLAVCTSSIVLPLVFHLLLWIASFLIH